MELFLKSAEHPTKCFFGRNEAGFIVFFFQWHFTDHGKCSMAVNWLWKIFLGQSFAIGKNLATYQELFKLPRTCSRVTMEKEFRPENIYVSEETA